MRFVILSALIATIGLSFAQEAVQHSEKPPTQPGMIGTVCSAQIANVEGTQTLELKMPVSERRTKTVHYREPVPNGKHRQKTTIYWVHMTSTVHVPLADVTFQTAGGTPVDPKAALLLLDKETTILFGENPSRRARELLRKEAVIVVPNAGARLTKVAQMPHRRADAPYDAAMRFQAPGSPRSANRSNAR